MSDRVIADGWLTAAECAERTGLTVRCLRLYEQYGLLTPVRTGKNWRLYGERELARLNEVLALKQLGISLAAMARLLAGQPTDLGRLLDLQKEALVDRRDRAERGLKAVTALRAKLQAGEDVSVADLLDLAKETNMTDQSTEAAAWRRYEQARPRTETPIDPQLYAGYAGFYARENGLAAAVSARDGRLFVRFIGQPELEVFPEAVDRFFYKALPAQISFLRDGAAAVSGFVLHQSGAEIQTERTDEAAFRAREQALSDKIAANAPYPGGADAARQIIADSQAGRVSKLFAPALAAVAQAQLPILRGYYDRLGAFKDVAFKGVDGVGLDRYEAEFEHGALELTLMLTPGGEVPLCGVRPLR